MGTVDWEVLFQQPFSERVPFITARGRNLRFVEAIADALQLDNLPRHADFATVKRGFTAKAVTKIHEAVVGLWPSREDAVSCIQKESQRTTAVYTGRYQPDAICTSLRRQALYTEKILLSDPFLHPSLVRDEYNPLLHPSKHRAMTAKWSYLWMRLAPWIQADIVTFIRPPAEFDPSEMCEIWNADRKKVESDESLQEVLVSEIDREMAASGPTDGGFEEYLLLSMSDERLRQFHRQSPETKGLDEQQFLTWIEQRRAKHPYYVEPLSGRRSEFHHETTGLAYEAAKRVCSLTNSHIVTDLRFRWKQLEIDHKSSTSQTKIWSPFAKALQNAELKILEKPSLETALELRRQGRLQQMRGFFNRVWRACRDPDAYADQNAVSFAAELDEQISMAQAEWDQIDRDLAKWMGPSAASLFASGVVGFVPAASAAIVGGVGGLVQSHMKRTTFQRTRPAGFFLGMQE